MHRLLPLALAVLVAAGCGTTRTVTVTTTETRTVTRTVTGPSREKTVRVYFLRDGDVAPVARSFDSVTRNGLLQAFFAGPTDQERAIGFTIAEGQGGPNVAPIVYMLSQFAPADAVTYRGVDYRRSDFEDVTPAILVESPLPYQTVSSPLRVTGTANTFEATFDYELRDRNGHVVSHGFVTATSGSGTRGTFDFTVRFSAPARPATLAVFERSAANGSRIHEAEIPLTPAR